MFDECIDDDDHDDDHDDDDPMNRQEKHKCAMCAYVSDNSESNRDVWFELGFQF